MERKYFNINFKVDNITENQEAKNQEISNMEIEVKNQRPNANELFRKAINGSSRQATNAESEEYDLWDVTANETLKRGAAMKDPIPLYEPFWYEGEIGILFAKRFKRICTHFGRNNFVYNFMLCNESRHICCHVHITYIDSAGLISVSYRYI